jgi:site-specific DNA recombinase
MIMMTVAIYARKSTTQDVADEQRSVARQVEHARAYAARKSWTVAEEHVYVDDGISGAEFANRPGFLRLMNALKPRAPFQVLVMSEESRLGREAIETAYALKQLIQAGVRVFFYLEDRERTLDSPTDKIMMSLTAFADELEREKARQRTYDAMQRKARAGHVTGGSCFGYENVDVCAADGARSHVARKILPEQAAVIRTIFELCGAGHGMKAIAKRLNDAGAPSPRAQRGRSQSWAPTSVREVLFRPLYRGEIVWNQTRKRDRWGQQRQASRPAGEWVHVPAPELRIVTDGAWQAAHARLDAARAVYMRGTSGRSFGRPALGTVSPYLLTNFATCGSCGSPLRVCTRSHGTQRARFYGCTGYHDRGKTVCANRCDVPMADADAIVLEAVLDDVLTPDVLEDAVDAALKLRQSDKDAGRREWLDAEIAKVEQESARFVSAIAAGGELEGLVAALREREQRKAALTMEQRAIAPQRPGRADAGRLHAELLELAAEWRRLLGDDPERARPILSQLLVGRVTFKPLEERGRWELTGEGTLAGFFRCGVSVGMASPTGLAPFSVNGSVVQPAA